jgi:MFS family permease
MIIYAMLIRKTLIALQNFKSLTASRVLSGLAASPVEALVTPVVADIFFVHQRGSRLAIWHTMIAGGVGLG